MSINGNVIRHQIDKNSKLINNKAKSVQVIFFGEVLPKFPTSLLTKKEIMDNKKGGTYSEARSKKETYKRRMRVSCDRNVEFLENRYEKYKAMGFSDEKAKDLAYKDLENEGFLW